MNRVSARTLDEAIAWQLCLDSGEASEQQRQDFARWLAAHPEHGLVWRRLGGIDQQLAAATPAPARRRPGPTRPTTTPTSALRVW